MENIALAFSGGGFRAAAFSLGSLSYLNKVNYSGKPLLQNVTFISSTSGGSITNLLYSAYMYEGKSFAECYQFLSGQLTGDCLLKNTLENLADPADAWKGRPGKNINLINAFSLEYDKLLQHRELSLFSNRNNHPHLEEICVNSTEFTNGYAFRFQSQNPQLAKGNGLIGNNYIFFTDKGNDAAGRIKLADILAASSCFPSGFEPLIFPHDCTHAQLSKDELVKGLSFTPNHFTLPPDDYNNVDFLNDKDFKKEVQFGLMDGGVADNQAIDAFILADERRYKTGRKQFDLFISCDVTSYFMDGYTLPVAKKKWYDSISFNTAKISLIIIWLLLAAWLPFSIYKFWPQWQWWNWLSAAVSALFFLPAIVILLKNIFKKKTAASSSWGVVFKKYIGVFTGMGLGRLKQLLVARAQSVFILANDVYLKQIRRMYYDRLYDDPAYNKRIIQNAIYDLSRAKFPNSNGSNTPKPGEPPAPSDAMKEVAEKARTMGTTLWFDESHERDDIKNCIIATGQFTCCYNLLKHIRKMQTKTPEITALEKELAEDYAAFLLNPMMMIP